MRPPSQCSSRKPILTRLTAQETLIALIHRISFKSIITHYSTTLVIHQNDKRGFCGLHSACYDAFPGHNSPQNRDTRRARQC
jgi:hypothetical protein